MKLTKKNFYVYKVKKAHLTNVQHWRVTAWLPQVRKWSWKKKFFKVRETSRNFIFSQGKFKSLKEVREKWNFKNTLLFFSFYVYCFLTFRLFCTFYRHESCFIGTEYCSWCWTSSYVMELPIHIDCTWLADSMNTWVDRVVLWEGLIPLSGFICETVN